MPTTEAPVRKAGSPLRWFDSWIKRLTATVVLVAGVLGIYKSLGGSDTKTPGNLTLITDVTVIENQYQEATGKPLTDANLKEAIRSAVNLAKAGQYDASRQLFAQLAATVPVPAVFNNLGALNAEKGDVEGARTAYQQAVAKNADYAPALQNLKKLTTVEQSQVTDVKGEEREPNNDFNHANEVAVGDKITAAIADSTDVDFYHFQIQTPKGQRDTFQASFENGGLMLRPGLVLYNANRGTINDGCYSHEALARVDCTFAAKSGDTFFVKVSGLDATSGGYRFVVTPLRRYDTYEPNDDFTQPTPLSENTTVDASIMDGSDVDFYQWKAGKTGQMTVKFENGGTTLRPGLVLYNANRGTINDSCYSHEAVASVDCSLATQAGSSYYVKVSGTDGTAGAYRLIVK
jgi:hypothetical protein